MKARDIGYETVTAISSNKTRSLLTILGIVIGIAAVISMTSVIDGVQQALVSELGLNQSRVVSIAVYPSSGAVTSTDIDRMERSLSSDYEFITSFTYQDSTVSNEENSEEIMVVGCEPEYFTVTGTKAVSGNLFSQEDLDNSAMTVNLNSNLAKKLFGSDGSSAVGKKVLIGNDSYTVKGIVEDSMSVGMGMGTGNVYMPSSTAELRLGAGNYSKNILGYAKEGSDMYAVADRTVNYLCEYFGITPDEGSTSDEFGTSINGVDGSYIYVQTSQQVIDQLDTQTSTFRMMAIAVAGISLLVGGIGIMNMMLTNVTERIREIGLRKALGARRIDISLQFLLESMVLCLIGGVFGIIVGYVASWGLAGAITMGTTGLSSITPVVTLQSVGLAAGICIGIGALFGWYPAHRAAKLDPVEALRYQ
ncbi:MAG: ABC transporter permease [Coriobacteriales bacterium]|jgi:ABC-type antimicrobial peptide transport system permease subunit